MSLRDPSALTPDDVDTRTLDFAPALSGLGETLTACAVSIVSGSAELASDLAGTWGATADATCVGTQAIVAIREAEAPQLTLAWTATTNSGRTLARRKAYPVETR